MTTIKVLHVYKTAHPFSYGGVESVIANLTDKLNSVQIKSDIVCIGNRTLTHNKAKTIGCPPTLEISSCPFSISMLIKFNKIAKEYDVIHYHYPWPFADILHLLFTRKKKTVVTYHSDIVKQKILKIFYKPVEYLFLKTVDKIVATSPQYCQISENLQKFRNKVSVIPLGIKALPPIRTKPSGVQKLPKDYFVFIGALRYYKGLHLVFGALRNSNHHLVIVGDGPMKQELLKLAQEFSVEGNLTFMGKLNDQQKAFVLQNAQALVLPSHLTSEAFGVALLEAASLGKPLISCKIGTGSEYVNINNRTGYCVQPEPEALRKALGKMANKTVAAKFGKEAKKRFEKYFSIDIIAKQYLKLYKSLCL